MPRRLKITIPLSDREAGAIRRFLEDRENRMVTSDATFVHQVLKKIEQAYADSSSDKRG